MPKQQIPPGYEEYFTGDRGEDCNPTVVDIKEIADRGLATMETEGYIQALRAISALCQATQTDPVE